MVFSSILSLLFFLPILFLLYFCVSKRFRVVCNIVLLTFNLFIYACGGTDYHGMRLGDYIRMIQPEVVIFIRDFEALLTLSVNGGAA